MEQQLNVTHKWHKIRDTINQRMPSKLTRTYAKLRIMKWIFQQQQKWTTELRFACKCALFVFGELEGSRTLESEIIFDFHLHLQTRDLTSYHHHCVRNTYTVISCIIYVYDVVALNELIRDMCMCWLRNFHLTHKRNSFCSTGSHKIIIFVSNHLYDIAAAFHHRFLRNANLIRSVAFKSFLVSQRIELTVQTRTTFGEKEICLWGRAYDTKATREKNDAQFPREGRRKKREWHTGTQ